MLRPKHVLILTAFVRIWNFQNTYVGVHINSFALLSSASGLIEGRFQSWNWVTVGWWRRAALKFKGLIIRGGGMSDGRLPDCVNSAGTSHPRALYCRLPWQANWASLVIFAALSWHWEVYMKLWTMTHGWARSKKRTPAEQLSQSPKLWWSVWVRA